VSWLNEKKPKFLGTANRCGGGIGDGDPGSRLCLTDHRGDYRIVSGVVCYYAVEMKNKLHWDDALDVWEFTEWADFSDRYAGHFRQQAIQSEGANGLLYGDPTFLLKEVTAVVFSSVWAFVFTYAMLRIIDGFTPSK